jgi:hypothetical protein
MLSSEHRNNSLKNIHPTSMRQKSIISLGNSMPRPASTDRLKIVLPNDPPHITAMYNVKMNFNINKDVINNNYVSGYPSTKLFTNSGKKSLDKLYITKQLYKPKSKEKYIKLDKSNKPPQNSCDCFYPPSPNSSNSSRVTIKDKDSINRNGSESRIAIDTSIKRNGSESKIFPHSSKVSPSPRLRTNNIFKVQNDSSSSESSFKIEKILSKKSQIKKKLAK